MSLLPFDYSLYAKLLTAPVVGAFIGYITNRIAIRMLFRPLKAWKVVGLHIPMTPGVIPAKRFELASNMGEVVGDHLLTSEEIGNGLKQEAFQEHLYNVIDTRIIGILNKDLDNITELVPEKFTAYVNMGAMAIGYQLKSQLRRFVDSPDFEEIIRQSAAERLTVFLDKDVGSIISGKQRETGYRLVEESFLRMFKSQPMEHWVEDFVYQRVHSILEEKRSLSQILPTSIQELLLESFEKQIPIFLTKITSIVREPQVRDKIVVGVITGVDSFIDSLGSMADMVRGFIRMETIEERIREYLAEKDDDIVAWLQSEEVSSRIVEILRERSTVFLAKPVADWIRTDDKEVVHNFCGQLSQQILLLLREKEVAGVFSSMITANIENHIESGDLQAKKLVEKVLGASTAQEAKQWAAQEILQLLQAEKTKATLDRMIDALIATLLQKRIGVLGRYIPAGVREGVSLSFQRVASEVLAAEVPGLVHSLGIRDIVTAKINSLDLLKLEGLLLSIMEAQFKYINLFGALLGFCIGCLNVVVMWGN
ncbi:MAG: hypothetical protein CSA20_05270 [Deltaproteobacteria bacterium]|nr:MAG: hypothetical protein CSA20_05270 [Deltaproteobacteria bacterium]